MSTPHNSLDNSTLLQKLSIFTSENEFLHQKMSSNYQGQHWRQTRRRTEWAGHIPTRIVRVTRHVVHVDCKYQRPQIRASETTLNPTLQRNVNRYSACTQTTEMINITEISLLSKHIFAAAKIPAECMTFMTYDMIRSDTAPWFCLFRLWRSINYLLTFLLTCLVQHIKTKNWFNRTEMKN